MSTHCIPSNPDISGIGVRLAIYIQTLFSFVPAVYAILDCKITLNELDLLEKQSAAIIATGTAIILSAAIQALKHNNLTNYHAMIVLNLSWMNNTNTFIYLLLYICYKLGVFRRMIEGKSDSRGDGSSELDRKQDIFSWTDLTKQALRNPILIIGSLHLCMMAVFGFWFWYQLARGDDGDPQCSTPLFAIILGQKVPLSSAALRNWSLFIYGLLFLPELNLIIPLGFFMLPYIIYNRATSNASRPKRRNIVVPIAIGLTCLAVVNIIFLVDIEVSIKKYKPLVEDGEDLWTFGQTLALALLPFQLPIRDFLSTSFIRQSQILGRKLLAASLEGAIDAVRYVTELGANVNMRDGDGNTALLLAAQNAHLDVVEYLITPRADVHAKDNEGRTALMLAAQHGHRNMTKYLIDHDADVNATDKHGITPLMLTAWHGYRDVAEYLIERSADVNARDKNNKTALMLAARHGHKDVVEYLVEHGADVNAKDNYNITALMLTARRGHRDVAKYLIEHGADVNANDKNDITALMVAARHGHQDVVEYLVEHGADVKAKDGIGNTVLSLAEQGGHGDAAKFLIEHGADVNAKGMHESSLLTYRGDR